MTAAPRRTGVAVRLGLAGIVALDLVMFVVFVRDARAAVPAAWGEPSAYASAVSSLPVALGLVIVGLLAIGLFALRRGGLAAPLVSLVTLAALSAAHSELVGQPWRHTFFSGLCLLGWIAGEAYGRWAGGGRARVEHAAQVGASALLGAAYLNAGLSKLAYGGLSWTSGAMLRGVLLQQDGLVADDVLAGLREAVAMSTTASAALSIGTVVFELAGPLLIAGLRVRRVVTCGLLGMHLTILATTGIPYVEAMVLLVLLGLVPRTEPAPAPPLAAGERHLSPRVALVVGGALVAAAIAGITVQATRYARSTRMAPLAGAPPSVPPPDAPATTRVQTLGPFSVGADLAPGWSVGALEVSGEGFVVAATREGGQEVVFDFACGEGLPSGPFDLATDAHITYRPSEVPFEALCAPGEALRDAARRALGGQARPCEAWLQWRLSAKPGSGERIIAGQR